MSMLRSLSCVLALAGLVSAQIVAPTPTAVTGVVKQVPNVTPGILCAPALFTLECSEGVLGLTPSGIDLTPYVGQNVKLTIVEEGQGCPNYSVLAVDENPPARLALCGTPEGLGCPIRLRSAPGGISQHLLFISLENGFVPQSVLRGSWLLGPKFFLIGSSGAGPIDPEGAAFEYVIPGDPQIIGIDFYLQAARRDVGPVGPWQLGNSVCFTPIGFTILCVQPDC